MDIPLTDEPNNIGIEIHISDVLKINDRDFSITFSLYFNVKWKEPRLVLDPNIFQVIMWNVLSIPLKKPWFP